MPKYVLSKTLTYSLTIEAENIDEAREKANNTDLRQGSETWGDTDVVHSFDPPCTHSEVEPYSKGVNRCRMCGGLLNVKGEPWSPFGKRDG